MALNSEIKKSTIKGLVQWDKDVQVNVTGVITPGAPYIYAVQDRDDGTQLQYNISDSLQSTGTRTTVTIPDDMMEQANQVTIYQQDEPYSNDAMECTAIVKCPITERPFPVDATPPEPSENMGMYYNALSHDVDCDKMKEVLPSTTTKITAGGLNIALSDIASIKLTLLDSSLEVTVKEQPIIVYGEDDGKLYLIYPGKFNKKLQLTVIDSSGTTYAVNVNSSNSGTSNYYSDLSVYSYELTGQLNLIKSGKTSIERVQPNENLIYIQKWVRAPMQLNNYYNDIRKGYPYLLTNT